MAVVQAWVACGGGAVGGAVVVGVEAVQVPGDGGVHGVVPTAVAGEQAGFGGPVQQRDPRLAVSPATAGTGRRRRGAHGAEGVDVDEALEQGEQGELGAFVFGEGVGEAVVEGGGQRGAAALRGVVGDVRGAGAELVHEGLDLVPGGVVVAEGLAGQDGDGERVARGELQQRPPVCHVQEPLAPPSWRPATARASSSRSSIGMPGSAMRAGRSPSQPCSSRREVSSTLHPVWPSRSRRKAASSSCSAGVQVLGVPAGNPATGSTLSQTHSRPTCASTCSATLRRCASSRVAHSTPRLGEGGAVVVADLVEQPGQRQVMGEGGEQHPWRRR